VPGAGSGARRRLLFRLGLAGAFDVEPVDASDALAVATSGLAVAVASAAATLASGSGFVAATVPDGALSADVAGVLVRRGGPDVTWADSPAGGAETRAAGTTVGAASALAEGQGIVDRVAQLGSGSGSLAAEPAAGEDDEGGDIVDLAGYAGAPRLGTGPDADDGPGASPDWAGTAIGGRLAPA
jgi:hypothetical protein